MAKYRKLPKEMTYDPTLAERIVEKTVKPDGDELIKNKVRSALIECRTAKQLTQTDVGKIVGKSKTAVASWEQGLSMPDAPTLYRLAKYYEKTIGYMYGEGT